MNSTHNLETFQKNPLDVTRSVHQQIDYSTITHSATTALHNSVFQGHVLPIHTTDQGIQALRAILQDEQCVKSDHIMYAYKLTDADGQVLSGYYDDKEWKGSSVLAKMIEENDLCDYCDCNQKIWRD